MVLRLDMSVKTLTQYLHQQGWLGDDDRVLAIEKPGEGNMNLTMRVLSEQCTLILKQANPFVQKYPQIAAPVERVKVEYLFYRLIQTDERLRGWMPAVVGFDETNRILAVEDLGDAADYTFIYQKKHHLPAPDLLQAVNYLNAVHSLTFSDEVRRAFPDNLALRRLNYEHLFVYPYMENNGFDLDTVQAGLQAIALPYQTNAALKHRLLALGEVYLRNGNTLLHGDFYPGSWLKADSWEVSPSWARGESGLRVIDPEFCHFGSPEYDVGVMMAHLLMAQTPQSLLVQARAAYRAPTHFDHDLAAQFTGMELMRRIIGLAQLPLDLTLSEKADLLAQAAAMVQSN